MRTMAATVILSIVLVGSASAQTRRISTEARCEECERIRAPENYADATANSVAFGAEWSTDNGTITSDSGWTSPPEALKYFGAEAGGATPVATSTFSALDVEVETWLHNGSVHLRKTANSAVVFRLNVNGSGSLYVTLVTSAAATGYTSTNDANGTYLIHRNLDLASSVPGFSNSDTAGHFWRFGASGFDLYAFHCTAPGNCTEVVRLTEWRFHRPGAVQLRSASSGVAFRAVTVRVLPRAFVRSDPESGILNVLDFGVKPLVRTGSISQSSTTLTLSATPPVARCWDGLDIGKACTVDTDCANHCTSGPDVFTACTDDPGCSNRCANGANDGQSCTADSDCTGGWCAIATCHVALCTTSDALERLREYRFGFAPGDDVIVEVGGESGQGQRGTKGVGGVWPALSYANTTARDADTTRQEGTFCWTEDDGAVARWQKNCAGGGKDGQLCTTVGDCPGGSACSLTWDTTNAPMRSNYAGGGDYYTRKSYPEALLATVVAVSGDGLTLTLNTVASETATNALVYHDSSRRLRRLLHRPDCAGTMNIVCDGGTNDGDECTDNRDCPGGTCETDCPVTNDLRPITPAMTVRVPAGDFALVNHCKQDTYPNDPICRYITMQLLDGWRLEGAGPEATILRSPRGAIGWGLHIVSSRFVEVSRYWHVGNMRDQGFGLNMSEWSQPQGNWTPLTLWWQADDGHAHDIKLTDVWQSVRADDAKRVRFDRLDVVLSQGPRARQSSMLSASDSEDVTLVDCTYDSPRLHVAGEAFKSRNVNWVRFRSRNGYLYTNDASPFLMDSPYIEIDSTNAETYSLAVPAQPVIQSNVNIGESFAGRGGVIHNATILVWNEVNDRFEVPRGISINEAANSNIHVIGGYYRAPDYMNQDAVCLEGPGQGQSCTRHVGCTDDPGCPGGVCHCNLRCDNTNDGTDGTPCEQDSDCTGPSATCERTQDERGARAVGGNGDRMTVDGLVAVGTAGFGSSVFEVGGSGTTGQVIRGAVGDSLKLYGDATALQCVIADTVTLLDSSEAHHNVTDKIDSQGTSLATFNTVATSITDSSGGGARARANVVSETFVASSF